MKAAVWFQHDPQGRTLDLAFWAAITKVEAASGLSDATRVLLRSTCTGGTHEGTQHNNDDACAHQGGKVRIDTLDTDFCENGGQCAKHSGQKSPEEPRGGICHLQLHESA